MSPDSSYLAGFILVFLFFLFCLSWLRSLLIRPGFQGISGAGIARPTNRWSTIRLALTALSIFWICGACFLYRKGTSLDQEFSSFAARFTKPPIAAPALIGKTHCIIQGISWYRVIGNDAEGKQFEGWVSEFAIKKTPPIINENDWIKKLPFPTVPEKLEPSRQEKEVSKDLKQALTQN